MQNEYIKGHEAGQTVQIRYKCICGHIQKVVLNWADWHARTKPLKIVSKLAVTQRMSIWYEYSIGKDNELDFIFTCCMKV